MTTPMTTCPDPTHNIPDEVRYGSDEAYRRWLDKRSPCPTCQGRA